MTAALAFSRAQFDGAVDRVFSSPAFQEGLESSSTGWSTILARVLQTILEWFRDLVRYFEDLHEAAPLTFWLIFIGLALVLLAILIHIGWTLSLAFRQAPAVRRGRDEKSPERRAQRFRDLRDEARRAARDGRPREATHFLLLALLALLEERQVLRVAAGWTNREILGRLRVQEDVAGSLGEFSDAVERVWYGREKLDTGGFDTLDRALDTIAPRLVGSTDSLGAPASGGKSE